MSFAEFLNKASLDEIKTALEAEPLRMRGRDSRGTPWSYYLMRRGDMALARYIVEYSRADMNEKDKEGRNILFPAIDSGSKELLSYLCERVGIDPLEADAGLLTPLEYASKNGTAEQYAYLRSRTGFGLDEAYHNPVRRGFSADPSVVRVGKDYYMVNSSFVHFPGLPISHSRDLVSWETIGHAVSFENPVDLRDFDCGRGFWAPDISYHDGRFYVVATLRFNDDQKPLRKQAVFSSEKPEGPYSPMTLLDEDGIDPSIFREDGRAYMLLNRGARIFELSEDLTEKLSEAELLYYGDCRKATEAPHLLKHGDYYYLFLAEGGTGQGHCITVARSRSLKGPYEPNPYNPIMRQKDAEAVLQRCGHGKPFQTADGRWYIVYLGARQYEPGLSALGRETFLDRLEWSRDGWPFINHNRGPSALAPRPWASEKKPAEEGFGKTALNKDFYFIRRAERENFELKDGRLALDASPFLPSQKEAGPILLRRQEEVRQRVSVCLETASVELGSMAGLLAYYDENSWYFLAAERRKEAADRLRLKLLKQEGRQVSLLAEQEIADVKELTMAVKIEGFGYRFYAEDKGALLFGFEDQSTILSDEGLALGKRFTGPGIGVAGVGRGRIVYKDFRMEAIEEGEET